MIRFTIPDSFFKFFDLNNDNFSEITRQTSMINTRLRHLDVKVEVLSVRMKRSDGYDIYTFTLDCDDHLVAELEARLISYQNYKDNLRIIVKVTN